MKNTQTEELLLADFEKLLKNSEIPVIDNDVNYWFVRTSSGSNFENFYFGNYIAIGWDKINDISAIKTEKHEHLKKHI